IAREKAGILKAGCPAVIGPQPIEALAAIRARADAIGVRLREWGRDFEAQILGDGRLHYWDETGSQTLPAPCLRGAHQAINAGTAIAALQGWTGGRVTSSALAAGMTGAIWPARLQRLDEGAL